MYKLVIDEVSKQVGCIIRLADKTAIPPEPANTDYQAYLAWLEEGNTPEQADEVVNG